MSTTRHDDEIKGNLSPQRVWAVQQKVDNRNRNEINTNSKRAEDDLKVKFDSFFP